MARPPLPLLVAWHTLAAHPAAAPAYSPPEQAALRLLCAAAGLHLAGRPATLWPVSATLAQVAPADRHGRYGLLVPWACLHQALRAGAPLVVRPTWAAPRTSRPAPPGYADNAAVLAALRARGTVAWPTRDRGALVLPGRGRRSWRWARARTGLAPRSHRSARARRRAA